MQVTLTKIYTTNKDKNGNELKTKDGRPYTRMSIKCEEYGDKWISGFKSKANDNWKEGDKVEVSIEQKGEYLNFEVPKKDDKVIEMLSQLLTKIGMVNAKLDLIAEGMDLKSKLLGESQKTDYPEEDINPEDIPF